MRVKHGKKQWAAPSRKPFIMVDSGNLWTVGINAVGSREIT
jgi:hypothetical protein